MGEAEIVWPVSPTLAPSNARLPQRHPEAVAVGEEADTVETVAEPFLVREGLIVRTSRGRAATALAWEHLGLAPPSQAAAYQASLLTPDDVGRFGT